MNVHNSSAGFRTIRVLLSDRAPVSIVEVDWPVIAHVGTEAGADRTVEYTVRESTQDDARVLVYGYAGTDEDGSPLTYAGFLLEPRIPTGLVDSSDIVHAIRRVSGIIGCRELAAKCIAALPEEEI